MKITQNLEILRQQSTNVETVQEAKDIIEKLEKALVKTDNGVGLGAIQIEIPKRIAVIKIPKKPNDPPNEPDKFLHLINAEVVSADKEFIYVNEGCLSLPGLFKNTKRYRHFVIKNYFIEGDELKEQGLSFYYAKDAKELGHDGLLSIATQHEIDHFDGKLLLDYNIENKPIVRGEKIGRNSPCPCGSGKKFKKCCIDK